MKVPTPVQETDELDPFRGSVISDEEAALESSGGTQRGEAKNKRKEVYIYPSAGTTGDGHRRTVSTGTGIGKGMRGEERMMTSAEMNMKSQFLMNLRPFGEESARSEGSAGTAGLGASRSSRSRLEVDKEGMLSEDEEAGEEEEEQLGPGSDFFT